MAGIGCWGGTRKGNPDFMLECSLPQFWFALLRSHFFSHLCSVLPRVCIHQQRSIDAPMVTSGVSCNRLLLAVFLHSAEQAGGVAAERLLLFCFLSCHHGGIVSCYVSFSGILGTLLCIQGISPCFLVCFFF